MTTMTITLEVRDAHLESYTDEHLANLWAAAQASTAPFGDRSMCLLVERMGFEIIRRWLTARRPSLYSHQISHFYRRMIDKAAGKWKDGEWFPEHRERVPRLNRDQLDGLACIVCGDTSRPMLPLGLKTSLSTEVFRCNRPECEVSPTEVQRWIDVSDTQGKEVAP